METGITVAIQPCLRARKVALLYLVVVLGAYGLPFLFGLSWLPTPGFPASTPPLPRYPYGYDNFSYSHLHLPYRHLAMDAVAHGEVPLWNVYNWLGMPIPAQYEVQVFSPLEWLDWLGGVHWWNFLLLAKIWAGGFGAFLLGRRVSSDWAGLAAGLLYLFGSFFIGFNSMEAFFNHAVILPWLFLLASHAFSRERGSLVMLGGGGLLFGICVTTGQPQIAAINLAALSIFILTQIILHGWSLASLRGVLLLTAAGVLGLLCGSLQIAFFQEALAHGYTIHPTGAYGGGGTAPLNFVLPLSPLTFGQLMAPWLSQMYPGRLNPEALPWIIGVTGSFLAMAGLTGLAWRGPSPLKRRGVVAFALLATAVLGLIIAGTIGYPQLWTHPLVSRINLPRYSGPLLTLCFAILGGYGFARLREGRRWQVATVTFLGLLVVAIQQGVVWPYLALPVASNVDPQYRLGSIWFSETIIGLSLLACLFLPWLARNPGAMTGLLFVAVAELAMNVRYGFAVPFDLWRLAVLALLVFAGIFWARDCRRVSAGLSVVAVLLLGGLLWKSPHRLTARRDFSAQTHPAITFLRSQLGPYSQAGRTLSTQRIMIPNSLSTYGIAQISGLNPVQIEGVAMFIRQTITTRGINYTLPVAWQGMANDPTGDWLTWQDYLAARSLFNRFNVRFLIDGVKGELSQVTWPDLERVYADKQYAIYEDRRALPRAYFVSADKTVFVAAIHEALGKMGEHRAATDEWLVVEGTSGPASVAANPGGGATVIIKDYARTQVSLEVNAPAAGYVVLSDANYPGWGAKLNGQEVPVLPAMGIVRAVAISAGTHRIDFSYHPAAIRIWLPVSIFAWILSGSLATYGFLLLRHPPAPGRQNAQPDSREFS